MAERVKEALEQVEQEIQEQMRQFSDVDEGQDTSLAEFSRTNARGISFPLSRETSNQGSPNSNEDAQRKERPDSCWKAS